MPRYDYQCLNCGEIREFAHSIHDPALDYIVCACSPAPQPAQRVILAMPAVAYKGYGFYRKDNLSEAEKYDYDHFDGSGTNSEIKAMERRIKDPESAIHGSKLH